MAQLRSTINWELFENHNGTIHVSDIAEILSLDPATAAEWMKGNGHHQTWAPHCDGPRFPVDAVIQLEKLVRQGRAAGGLT